MYKSRSNFKWTTEMFMQLFYWYDPQILLAAHHPTHSDLFKASCEIECLTFARARIYLFFSAQNFPSILLPKFYRYHIDSALKIQQKYFFETCNRLVEFLFIAYLF